MAKKVKYANTGSGREAEAEEIDAHVASARRFEGRHQYERIYTAATERQQQGEQPAEIHAALTTMPHLLGPLESGEMPYVRQVHNAIEEELADIRREALEDALAGRPAVYKHG